jgi:hypothetical protein
MSASNSELQDDAADGLAESLETGVIEYRVGSRMKRMESSSERLKTLLTMQALNSPRRGMNLARIDRPA